jgi:hypothetical protein
MHVLSLMTKNWWTRARVVSLPEPVEKGREFTSEISGLLSRMTEPCPETQIDESDYGNIQAKVIFA